MTNLKFIKELIGISSYDTTQNKQIIEYLIKQFKPYSQEIIKIKNINDNRENLIIGLNTKLKNINNAIILSGHIDTVVADESNYKTNPYIGVELDGKIYGLGAVDMKSFFACILSKINELKDINKPIIVAITSDEETYLQGVKLIVNKLKELNVIPKFTIVGEPTNKNICVSSKSCYEYQIDVFGKSCHSSKPQNGINANYVSARLITLIEKLSTKYKNTTLSCNVISGGEKINIISAQSSIRFDLRSDSAKFKDKALYKINKYIKKLENKYGAKISLKQNLNIPALENKKSTKIIELANKYNLKVDSFRGGCEAGYFQKLSGNAFVFGVGDLNLAHKPNEFVDINELKYYADNLISIIKDL